MQRSILDAENIFTDLTISRRLKIHKATVCRWRTRGVSLPDGTRRRLLYTRCGKRALVHPDDLRDFLTALTTADQEHLNGSDEGRPPRSSIRRRPVSRAEQAEREADELGL
ncbi:MAG: hypothetical protein WD294_17020 [Phycisphaeraceae bacterium]